LTNSLAALPFALLQGIGRSDTTAKVHLVEAPVYLLLIVWLIQAYGITGAAVAWCARTTLDMTLLYWFAVRKLQPRRPVVPRHCHRRRAHPALCAGLLVHSPLHKVSLTLILMVLFGAFAWHRRSTRVRISSLPEIADR